MASVKTQRDRILEWLYRHGELTTKEAVIELGIMSLPKRIEELRKSGHAIKTEFRTSKNGARYGVYSFVEE